MKLPSVWCDLNQCSETAFFIDAGYDEDDNPILLNETEKKIRLPGFKKGDVVALVYDQSNVVFTEKITSGTIGGLLEAIDRGMRSYIPSDLNKKVYTLIGYFIHGKNRLLLSKKFERGKLTPKDLLGDHHFMEGGIRRIKGVWVYATGS